MSLKSTMQCVMTAMVVIGLMAVGASAQVYRGSINGRVTDPAGAVVPGAKITITNTATNAAITVGSSAAGQYSAPNLLPGLYTVSAAATGFKTLVRQNIQIRTGVALGLDLALTVGSQSQEVTVTSAPLLITDSGSQDTVLNLQLSSRLPLSGTNIFLLATTAPGQTNGISGPLSNRPFDNGGEDSFSFNGAPGGGNNNAYLIDGMPDNNNEGMGFVPAPDAVSEVNIMTNQYDAEYGHTAGGTVSVALKTGANQYHGDAYYDYRTNRLNANLFQNNRVGQSTQNTQWHVPGFQIGGPLVIPGVYNGHNKTFFSVSYQHFFDQVATGVNRSYPTVSQMQGNFCSGAPGNQGVGRVIYDPTTTDINPFLSDGVTKNPNYGMRTAFGGCPGGQTGSIIPANRILPQATTLFALLPATNVPGCTNQYASGCSTNYQSGKGQGDHYYSTTVRVDETMSPTESFFASYEVGNRTEFITNPGAGANDAGYFPIYNTWRINHGAGFNLTSILSPTTV
ncbi:MAG TPA: carboxypeptidase-like regulatory domain-containing protein, partial [Terriglobales bacterium]